jgi:hypothetical protein
MSAAMLLHTVYLMIRRELRWSAAVGRLLLYGMGAGLSIGGVVYAIYRTSDPAWAWNAVVEFNRLYFKAKDGSRFLPRFFAIEEHLKVMGLPLILALATLVQPVLWRILGTSPEGETVRTFRRATQPLPPRGGGVGQSVVSGGPANWPYAVSGGHAEGVVTLPDEDPIGKRPDGMLFLIWAWFIVAVYLALLGPHQRLQYYGVALPPLVMICAHAVHLLLRAGRRIPDVQPAYPVVVGVLWFGYMMVWPVQAQVRAATVAHHHRFEEEPDARLAALLEAVRRHTMPDDAIFVSGYGPKLYWDAERRPAIRYIGTEKVGQLGEYGEALKAELVGLLKDARPAAIVIDAEELKVSVHPRVSDFQEMKDWLNAEYARPEDYPESNLWIRRKQ